jgi:hypothetical protein
MASEPERELAKCAPPTTTSDQIQLGSRDTGCPVKKEGENNFIWISLDILAGGLYGDGRRGGKWQRGGVLRSQKRSWPTRLITSLPHVA